MKDRILRLIMDSFKDEFYNKAMSCIHALRKESIKVNNINSSNVYHWSSVTTGGNLNETNFFYTGQLYQF